MELLINKKYLVLPINRHASPKKLCFYENGTLIYELDCRLDSLAPNYTAYAEMTPFLGKTVEIRCNPTMDFTPKQTDTPDLPNLFREPYRPQIHFTVPNGWNNDPNGLIKYKGEYHLFYQYNPCAPQWGNMHWGHAVSKDLLHWEYLDTALYPDERGVMYSGCAIEDRENRTGLGNGTETPLLIYYTAAARGDHLLSKGKRFTQCLAVSDGRKITKYENNPVVCHFEGANRDPKVVWVEEIGRYVMAIFLAGHRYRMLTSDDLLHWNVFTDLELDGDGECPDLFPLTCDGEKKWVFCGASDRYIIGSFTEKGFVSESEPRSLQYSAVSYAAQSYAGLAEENRVVRMPWHRLSIPEDRFSQQMGIPVEMALSCAEKQYYLSALPIRELETLREEGTQFEEIGLAQPLRFDVGPKPVDMYLQLSGIEACEISLFGCVLKIDPAANQLSCDKLKMPLSIAGDGINLRIVADRAGIEIFADHGRFCMTVPHLCDYNLPYVELRSSGEERATGWIYSLRSVYSS